MLMHNQHLYTSLAIEVYGHCRLLLPWMRVPSWFFCNPGLKNCWHGRLGVEPTTNLSSQPGAYDLSGPNCRRHFTHYVYAVSSHSQLHISGRFSIFKLCKVHGIVIIIYWHICRHSFLYLICLEWTTLNIQFHNLVKIDPFMILR